MMPPSPRLTLKGSLESGALRSSLYAGRQQTQGQGGLGQSLQRICRRWMGGGGGCWGC